MLIPKVVTVESIGTVHWVFVLTVESVPSHPVNISVYDPSLFKNSILYYIIVDEWSSGASQSTTMLVDEVVTVGIDT